MTIKDLQQTEYDNYYSQYVNKLSSSIELRNGFEIGRDNVISFFKSIPLDKLDYKYAEGKWSIKEVFQHIIDTERIFMYRVFRISRYDDAMLTGYDQNIYIEPSNAQNKNIDTLLNEFKSTREYSINLLNSLSDKDLQFVGNSNGAVMSGRAAAFTILGHEIWHIDVIKNKYL